MNRPADLAEDLLESGIRAMKIWPFDPAAQATRGQSITAEQMRTAVRPFEEIRSRVGDAMEIMVEFHSLWNLPTAMQIARVLEPYAPTWYEDPIRMNSPQALAEFAASTTVWTCASETLGSRWPYKDMLDRNAMHVVMVDLCWSGGLTEGRKIAALAETWHRPLRPARLHRTGRLRRGGAHGVQPAEHPHPGERAGVLQGLVHGAGNGGAEDRGRGTCTRWRARDSGSSSCPRSSNVPT